MTDNDFVYQVFYLTFDDDCVPSKHCRLFNSLYSVLAFIQDNLCQPYFGDSIRILKFLKERSKND